MASLCTHAWRLDPNAIGCVLGKIDALVTTGMLTEGAVALALRRAGVTESAATTIAPSITLAVLPSTASCAPGDSWPVLDPRESR